ncbi:MAG: OB-fold domain-containing protein [Actinobacteria bacterium]|nr:OB-fold domain-containing protein [Actinomycetota bacterium]
MNDPAEDLWKAWADGRLCIQNCTKCGSLQHPPGPVCACCHATTLGLIDIAPTGKIVAWSTVHRAPSATFADEVPYTIAIIAIDPTTFIESRVSSAVVESDLRVDMSVRLELGEIGGRAMPVVAGLV